MTDFQEIERDVVFRVVGKLEPSHALSRAHGLDTEDRFWLQASGLRSFRNIPKEVFHLAKPNDLRIISPKLSFELQSGYIPLEKTMFEQFSTPPFAKLTRLGRERIETPAGGFDCERYQIEIGEKELQVWVNPKIYPLGIVRITSVDEKMELVSFGYQDEVTLPQMIEPLIQGISTLGQGCSSCHASEHECHTRVFPPL